MNLSPKKKGENSIKLSIISEEFYFIQLLKKRPKQIMELLFFFLNDY